MMHVATFQPQVTSNPRATYQHYHYYYYYEEDDEWMSDLENRLFDTLEVMMYEIFPWVSLALSIFGVITNIINLVVFSRQGIFSDNCTPCLVGLAISDWFVCVFLILTIIVGQYRIEEVVDKISYVSMISTLFYQVTCCLTLYLSIERTISVVFPFKVKTLFTPKRSGIAVVCVASFGVALRLPLMFDLGAWSQPLADFSTIGLRGLCIVGVVLFNIIIVIKVVISKRFRERISAKEAAPQLTGKKTTSLNPQTKTKGLNKDQKEMRLVKMMAFICTMFAMFSSPSVLAGVLGLLSRTVEINDFEHKLGLIIAVVMPYTENINSCINFPIYMSMSTKFRKEFGLLFGGILKKSIKAKKFRQVSV